MVNRRSGILIGIVIIAALAGVMILNPDAEPRIFTKMTLAAARESVRGTEKVLVVKATASWCGPCKRMDRVTWRDDEVEKWFAANGVVIALDVDAHADEARALGVEAMPTMIAFDGKGAELGRVEGFMDADELLSWVAGLKREGT